MADRHDELFTLIEIPGILVLVGDQEEGPEANRDGDNALDDVQPPPASHTADAFHFEETRGDETTDDTRQRRAHVQVAQAEGHLGARVECCHVENQARREGCFTETEQQPACDDCSVRLCETVSNTDSAPHNHHAGDHTRRSQRAENDGGRCFEDDIGDCGEPCNFLLDSP